MSEQNQYIQLCKKLKALSEQGVGGEKYNAKSHLDRLMKKHGITEFDLEEDSATRRVVMIEKKHLQLFFQVLSTILGKNAAVYKSSKRNHYEFDCTNLEYTELFSKFDFYVKCFETETKLFFSAFIMRNKLFPKDTPVKSVQELTQKEREELYKAHKISESLTKHHFNKQIEK